MEDQGKLLKGHFPDWVPAPSENPLSIQCTRFSVLAINPKPLTPLYCGELTGGLPCPLALCHTLPGFATPERGPRAPQTAQAHTYRLQAVFLSLALVGTIDEGTCGDFVVVQEADDHHHHHSDHHDDDEDLGELQLRCKEEGGR